MIGAKTLFKAVSIFFLALCWRSLSLRSVSNRMPLTEAVAVKTSLVMTTCSVTRELYGYAAPVLDEAATMAAFCANYRHTHRSGYHPSATERAYALDILTDRFARIAAN